ncbi:MAG: hypothetical protein ACE5EG_00760, partial [Thermoanaerobaculia bacterium]
MRLGHARSLLAACLLLVTPPGRALVAAEATGWPGLRGPGHDGAVRDARLFEGEIEGLEVAWQRALGSGYPVVVADGERLVVG